MTKKIKPIKVGDEIDFSKLVNEHARLIAYNKNPNCFRLGSIVFEVVEDENDGYRSSMQNLIVKEIIGAKGTQLDTVQILDADIDGFKLVGSKNHVWLVFGTDNSDSYYPSFIFNWQPVLSDSDLYLQKAIKQN